MLQILNHYKFNNTNNIDKFIHKNPLSIRVSEATDKALAKSEPCNAMGSGVYPSVISLGYIDALSNGIGNLFAKYFPDLKKTAENLETKINKCVSFISPFIKTVVCHRTYIHEWGHALASLSCYVESNPRIAVNWDGSGVTRQYINKGLTRFGKLLGKKNSGLLFSAGGSIAESVAACSKLALSYPVSKIQDGGLFYATVLGISALWDIIDIFAYAMSTFDQEYVKKHPGHDFHNLWKEGNIHPGLASGVLGGIPLWLLVFYKG